MFLWVFEVKWRLFVFSFPVANTSHVMGYNIFSLLQKCVAWVFGKDHVHLSFWSFTWNDNTHHCVICKVNNYGKKEYDPCLLIRWYIFAKQLHEKELVVSIMKAFTWSFSWEHPCHMFVIEHLFVITRPPCRWKVIKMAVPLRYVFFFPQLSCLHPCGSVYFFPVGSNDNLFQI